MPLGMPIAHAGHPAEWLPFVVPVLLVALVWFGTRIREAVSVEDAARRFSGEERRRRKLDGQPSGGGRSEGANRAPIDGDS